MKNSFFLFYFQLLTETKNEDVVIEVISESGKLYFIVSLRVFPPSFPLKFTPPHMNFKLFSNEFFELILKSQHSVTQKLFSDTLISI
jgi:hypothetical protein